MTQRLSITAIGHRGDGIAEVAGETIYVPFTLPGEIAQVDAWPGHPDRRQLIQLETNSPDRIAPICPHFGACGGCSVQHWAHAAYRSWKLDLLGTALRQHDLTCPIDAMIDAHGEGRRRAVFHANQPQQDILELGFTAARSHHIVSIDHCPILAPDMAGAVTAAWAVAQSVGPIGKPLDIQVTATDNGLDIDVRGSGALSPSLTARLARLAESRRLARLTRHGELVIKRAPPTLRMGKAIVELPPGSFLQATRAGEQALADHAATHVGAARRIADLFCGVGPFALRLAERAQIHAVDSDVGAITALAAAAKAPGLKPIKAEARDLFLRPLAATELDAFDAVIFDPPRQGADAQAREIAKSKVKTVVAISCNIGTFARDARMLVDGGYRLVAVTPVDQFRYSSHLEIVAKFVR